VTFEDNGCVSTLTPSIFEHWIRTEKGEVTEDHLPTPQDIAEHLQPVDP